MDIGVSEGQLVFSRSGRDRGKPYLIRTVLGESFVLLVNGESRGFSNPKRKNLRHLEVSPKAIEDIAKRLKEGRPVSDEEVKNALRRLTGLPEQNPEKEVGEGHV